MTEESQEALCFKTERNVLLAHDLDAYRIPVEPIHGAKGWMKYAQKHMFQCNSKNVYRRFIKFFPFVDWIQTYKWKEYIKYDMIAGFTIGIMNIPQALAYAKLSALPPVTGLYMSFIMPLLYMLTGSSKGLSYGTYSIIALLVSILITSDLPQQYANNHKVLDSQNVLVPMNLVDAQLIVSATLTFYTGVIQIVMSLFKIGFITNFLSTTTTSGFIFGSAIQVVTTQLGYLLGVSVPSSFTQGISPAIKTYIYVFPHLPSANVAEIIITILGVAFLVSCRYLNVYAEKIIHFPIPSELLLIIISTGISYGVRLDTKYKVRITGNIPSGLPKPVVPDFTLTLDVLTSAITIAIVAYAITISLAKGIASKKGEKISYNGELFSYGFCTTIGSFFQCFVPGSSLSRTSLLSQLGRTQLSGILSAIIIIIVLLVASSLFYYLPLTILSCIILVALFNVFKTAGELKLIWRLNKFQAFLWVLTAAAVVCLDVQYGLLVGVATNILYVLYKVLVPKLTILGEIEDKHIYLDKKIFIANDIDSDISIVQFSTSILYLNFERFSRGLNAAVDKLHVALKDSKKWGVVIIDGKYMIQSDIEGGQVLHKVIVNSPKKHVKIYLANTGESFLKFMEKYLKNFKCEIQSFATVTDAVVFAKNEIRHLNESVDLEAHLEDIKEVEANKTLEKPIDQLDHQELKINDETQEFKDFKE